MDVLSPFQQGIKLLSEGNTHAARLALLEVRRQAGNDASAAARFLAHLDKNQRRYGAAVAMLTSSLEELGEDSATLAQLAELYMALGQVDDAIPAAERSLELQPDNSVTALNVAIWRGNSSENPLLIKQAFEQWSAEHLDRAASDVPLRRPDEVLSANNRPIRIGYVSGDLGNHPVRYLIEPYLRLHDPARFEVHAFMSGDEDEISAFLKEWVPHWHSVQSADDNALLGLIRGLEIDILVDLSGHTENSRLGVFAARAAPVQLTWWGFVHTLGLKEIDYRLTDWVTCPAGTEAFYTESLCRMTCHTAYSPPANSDNQYTSPWGTNGYVTMISLNHSRKISDAALNTWCKILKDNPNSGLIIVTSETSEAGIKEHFLPRLEAKRLPMDRVSAVPRLTMLQYMNVASVADFALDSFPVSGGVTTLHALWMGLPVLTLTPATNIAMQTYSGNTLRLVGLTECIATSAPELVSRASQWIKNPTLIDKLRERARPNLIASPFMNHKARVKELEACFTAMWRRYIDNQPVTDLSSADVFDPRDS